MMQPVRKKKRAAVNRRGLLIAAAAALAAIVAAALLLGRGDAVNQAAPVSTAEDLFVYAPAEIVSITVRRGEEDAWTVLQEEAGLLTRAGEDSFALDEATSAALLDAASILPCEAVLTEDPGEYRDHLADFGLDDPEYELTVAYRDGVTAHLFIGDPGAENRAWYYMLVEGDDRLFSFSRGMVESLFISRDALRTVVSPTIHKARIDRVTLTSPEGIIEWELSGRITDADAADRWRITSPIVYPADATAMDNLLKNLANLRLGAYVGPATAENLTAYGFDAPRLTIGIHMAAGAVWETNAEGAVEAVEYPESDVTFVIGGAQSDMVDYVRCGDGIYVSSHFTMGVFLGFDPAATLSRYPVVTALGNLASLRIERHGEAVEYALTRTEQVAENNALVTDEAGNPVYDVTVTRNGEPLDYAAFEAAYNALCLVTVSGTLPDGAASSGEAHTVYTFTDVDGTAHTVALADFDVLHDAVSVDGQQVFYLIKGGFDLGLD